MSEALTDTPLVRITLPPLYELEGDLVAMLDTEAAVPPEQEQSFRAELAVQLQKTVAKRDRVRAFIVACERGVEDDAEEIDRIQRHKRMLENAAKRVRGYIGSIIESFGKDEHGKFRKLPGSNFTFSLRASPSSLEVDNEALVPKAYKRVRVDMPAEKWEAICALPGFLQPTPVASYYVDGAVLKSALESPGPCPECKGIGLGELDEQIRQQCEACGGSGVRVIPGAHLGTGKNALVIR